MITNLPPGVTEQQVLDAIENAVGLLSSSFSFGIFDKEDIAQEIRMECLRVLRRYDPKRPLDNFLFVCSKNYLVRLKRDKLRRTDPPCKLCHDGVPHERGGRCDVYDSWKKRNDAKASLQRPLDVDLVQENTRVQGDVVEDVEVKELLRLVDDQLPVEMRADWLKLRAGQPVPKPRRNAVEQVVKEILGDALPEVA